MKGPGFLILIFFTLFLKGYSQAIYTTNGTCSPDQEDYFSNTSCWTITGCTPAGGAVVKNTFPPPASPALEVGTTRTISEGFYEEYDEDSVLVTVRRLDYVITADGDILDLEVGEAHTFSLGDRFILHTGTELIAEVAGVAPDPIYDLRGTSTCPVEFVIDHPINTGNINIKSHVTIKVNSGGVLNVNQVTMDREIISNIIVDGGELIVRGSLIPESARNNQPKTKLNIKVLNGGVFNVEGLIDMKNNTHLVIDGDGTSYVETRNISFNQGVILDILADGGLLVHGDTRFNGNDSKFNIAGYFETKSLTVAGGRGLELNTIGNATVKIQEDVAIRGDATKITFGGDSSIEVGGDFEVSGGATTDFKDNAKTIIDGSVTVSGNSNLNVSGNAEMDIVGGCDETQPDCDGGIIINGGGKLTVTGEAEVYVCGERPTANNDEGVTVTTFCPDATDGEPCATYAGCRVLPVNFEGVRATFNGTKRATELSWSTAKEWENSHFEIERSIDGIGSFEVIGSVDGNGWTESISEYEFVDDKLPLKGGSFFYRLKQVDFNETFEYSEIVAVRVPQTMFTEGVWRAYPNPVNGSEFQLELLDAMQYDGETILCRIFSSTTSSAQMTFRDHHELKYGAAELLGATTPGLWILEVQWGNKVERIKIVKR